MYLEKQMEEDTFLPDGTNRIRTCTYLISWYNMYVQKCISPNLINLNQAKNVKMSLFIQNVTYCCLFD